MPSPAVSSVALRIYDDAHAPQQVVSFRALGVVSVAADRYDCLDNFIAQSGMFELDHILGTGKPQGFRARAVDDRL